ncbi:hypothetical protein FRB94_002101, partial [Tulasnella sp. JGI-2019a]
MKSVIGEQSPYPVTASAASDVPVAPPVAPPAESADDSPISDLPSFVLDDKSALVPANVTAASSPSLPPPLNNDTSLGDSGAPILFDGQGGGTRHFQGAENTPEKTRDRRNKKTLARPSTQINPREKKVQKLQQPQVEHLNTALADLGQYHIPFERLEIDESSVIGRGGFGVVMRGKLSGYHSEVAIKRLRSDETRDIRVAKRLIREMKAWSGLEHPNILPLIGFYLSKGLDLALIVCPLQFHGNVKDYLQRVKPSILERLTLALDILSAIEYLHSLDPPVVHGDIKALNILISSERRAVLCDFGLALAAGEVATGLTTSVGFKGSVRYCSPELVMHDESRRTVSSDIWAWGCLLVEIVKETFPYSQLRSDFQVIFALTNRVPPESEEFLTHPINIWSIVQGCWHIDPELRSTAEAAAKNLRLL